MAEKKVIDQLRKSMIDICDSMYCKSAPNCLLAGITKALVSLKCENKSCYTTLELCDKFGVSSEQIRRMWKSGYFIKLCRNTWDKKSVDEYYTMYYKK